MFEHGTRRRLTVRLGVVLVAMIVVGSLSAGLAHAAGPFTISITEPVGISGLTVLLSGTADSPSHSDHHIVIEWGDTNTDNIPLGDGPGPWNWGPLDHTYAAAGTYTITTTIIHASDNGNDRGESATDSTVVEVVTPDPCVDPSAPECNPTDDGGEETPPPADKPEVLGETKKPLPKTASPAIAALWTAIIVLMIGATVRFCAVDPAKVEPAPQREDLVAKSLELVNRMVRARG